MLRLKILTIAFCAALFVPMLVQPQVAQAQEILCDAVHNIDGWGIYAKETPADLAFLLPDPPEGYVYAAQPAYTGYCEVFAGIKDNHQPLPVQICLVGSGDVAVGLYYTSDILLNRTWSVLPTEYVEGKGMCASLPVFGDVALLAGITLPTDVITAEETPTEVIAAEVEALREQLGDGRICTINTTHRVNFRLSPDADGEIANSVPLGTTLGAVAIEDGWYQVQWMYQMGWIDGDYLTASCLTEEDMAAQQEIRDALLIAEETLAARLAAEEEAAAEETEDGTTETTTETTSE